MSINSISTEKETSQIDNKSFILKCAALTTAAATAGMLIGSYFWGREKTEAGQEMPEISTALTPLAQDIALFVGSALPSFALLGVGAHVARGEQPNLIRKQEALEEEANLFLESLEEDWNYLDTCLPEPSSFSPQNPQCVPLASREERLREMMEKKRDELRLTDKEMARYGNKHSNLMQMAHLDAALELEGLEIPLPEGIASDDVVAFLQRTKPEIFKRWEVLAKLYEGYQGNSPFLQTKEAQEHLKHIDRLIEEAFSETTDPSAIGAPLDWLQEREKAKDFLMIRSTGAEDSKKSANAGGNLSRAYIRGTPEEFMEAVGSVVASYFGEKSLQNRIDSEINPFEEPLQLAVTVQKLIGEPVGGTKNPAHIPTSFVVFTNEPLYIGNEKFRVMRISASYGHGEGVVGNQGIATDTVLLLRSESDPEKLYVLYENQKKIVRLAPLEKDGKISLGKLKNPKYLVNQRALNERNLAQIYRSALVMESFYEGHPTDIEGVIKDGIVYFVQARPVNRKPMLPTFLRHKEGSSLQLQAESLVAGKASVLEIRQESEVLIAPTLEIAEQMSAAMGMGSYRLIVVSQPEPQNSHPVVNFSSQGIPCLWISDLEAVQDLLKKIDEDHSLAVCMQTASIHLWDKRKASLEESVEEGFGVHPAKIAISLPVAESFSAQAEPSKELSSLLIQLRDVSSPEEAFIILEEISRHTKPLKEQIARIEKIPADAFSLEAHRRLLLLKELDQHIERALQEVREHCKNPQNKRLEGLFLLKALETLMIHPSNSGAVGGYSLLQVESIVQSIDLLIEYQQDLSEPALLGKELLAGWRAVHSEAFPYWTSLLKDIEKEFQKGRISKEELKKFTAIIANLEDSGALSQWIYLLPQNKDLLGQFQTILQEFSVTNLTFLKELGELKEIIRGQHLLVDRFSNSAAYEAAWEELAELISLVSSKEWLEKVQKMSPTNRMIAYRTMEKALTLLDESLKKVKVGNFGNEKGKIFKQMLKVYFELMKNWAGIVPEKFITNHRGWPLHKYLTKLEGILKELNDTNPEGLLPSRGFSVAAAVLNAGTDFDRHYPQTLEDMLTLLHQNSINWIASLNQDLLSPERLEESLLPISFKQIMKDVGQTTLGGRIRVERTGIEINEDTFIIHYNVPLRNHSGQIDLIYDIRSSKWTMKGKLLGEARERWPEIANGITILEDSKIFSPTRPFVLGEKELIFSWEITSETLSSVLREYGEMANHSLNGRYGFFLENLINRWSHNPNTILEMLNKAEKLFNSADSGLAGDICKILFKQNLGIPQALDMAEKALFNTDSSLQQGALNFYPKLFEQGKGHSHALDIAEKASFSPHISVQRSALNFYQKLVEQKQGYFQAIGAAEKGLLSPDTSLQQAALNLYQKLVQQGEGYSQALDSAEKGSFSPDASVQQAALNLYQELVKQGQGYSQALDTAEKASFSPDASVQQAALNLYQKLVEQGEGHFQALRAAEKASFSPDASVQRAALILYQKLVELTLGYSQALDAAEKASLNSDSSVQLQALILCQKLVEKKQGYSQAIGAVEKASLNSDSSVQLAALILSEKLVILKLGYSQALDVAEKASRNSDSSVQERVLSLYKMLLEQKQGYPQILAPVEKALYAQDFFVQYQALSIYEKLIEQKQGYPQILAAAEKALLTPNFNVQRNALSIYEKLLDQKQGYPQILAVAEKSLLSSDQSVQQAALDLYKKLFERNEGFSQALNIAEKLISRNNNEDCSRVDELYEMLLTKFSQKLSYSEILNIRWRLAKRWIWSK